MLLIGVTNNGCDPAPCEARLHTGLNADCPHLDMDAERDNRSPKAAFDLDVGNPVSAANAKRQADKEYREVT